MNVSRSHRTSAVLTVLALFACLASPACADNNANNSNANDETTFRDLVRKYNKDGNGKTLAKQIGFSKEVEHVVALEYTVLILSDGKESPVPDPKTHQFKLGDQIKVRLQPVSDTHIYIFHQGASGNRVCLLPTKEEKPPFVKANTAIVLPEDGYFEFSAPPGSEELLVVATEKPVSDLAGLANVVFNKPDDQLTPEEKEIKKNIRAKVQDRLKSIREHQAETTTYRGLLNEEGVENLSREVKKSNAPETTVEEPGNAKNPSNFAMVASTKKETPPALFVTIQFRSIAQQSSKP